MSAPFRYAVLIPARDEADTLPRLFAALAEAGVVADPRTPADSGALADPRSPADSGILPDALPADPGSPGAGAGPASRIVVVDNGSSDATAAVAERLGALVAREPRGGYGRACLAGIGALCGDPPDALVFLDADDFLAPGQLALLLAALRRDEADLVIGERVSAGPVGGVRLHARLGNRLVLAVMRLLYGSGVRDMGPFRAIRWGVLRTLRLDDRDYGWYVQMQVRALRAGARVVGVPVSFERRTVGRSKVSGNPLASIRAGYVMLRTLAVECVRRPIRTPPRVAGADVAGRRRVTGGGSATPGGSTAPRGNETGGGSASETGGGSASETGGRSGSETGSVADP